MPFQVRYLSRLRVPREKDENPEYLLFCGIRQRGVSQYACRLMEYREHREIDLLEVSVSLR